MDGNLVAFNVSLSFISIEILRLYFENKVLDPSINQNLKSKAIDVYETTLSYFLAIWYESPSEINKKRIEFIKVYKKSQFIFEKSTGIYETLGEIQHLGSYLHEYEKADGREKDLNFFITDVIKAKLSFQEKIIILEKQIQSVVLTR